MDDQIYYSNASWTKVGNSRDSHYTRGQFTALNGAMAVCERLLEDYGAKTRGCEVRGHCLDSWVTDEKGNKVEV